MKGNRTNHFPNKTTFIKGYKRTPESIKKQKQTMVKNYKLGLRKPPKPNWNTENIARMVSKVREASLKRYPIGSKRKHLASKGMYYWLIKVSPVGKWKFEHRVVMENFLKRKLNRFEIVHHKNKNTLDNDIKNLQLMTSSEHTIFHHTKH